TISLPIITYAIAKHKLLDLTVAISFVLTRMVIYLTLLVIFAGFYFLVSDANLLNNKLQLFGWIFLVILACETYGFATKKVQKLSEIVLADKRKKNEGVINSLSRSLVN